MMPTIFLTLSLLFTVKTHAAQLGFHGEAKGFILDSAAQVTKQNSLLNHGQKGMQELITKESIFRQAKGQVQDHGGDIKEMHVSQIHRGVKDRPCHVEQITKRKSQDISQKTKQKGFAAVKTQTQTVHIHNHQGEEEQGKLKNKFHQIIQSKEVFPHYGQQRSHSYEDYLMRYKQQGHNLDQQQRQSTQDGVHHTYAKERLVLYQSQSKI